MHDSAHMHTRLSPLLYIHIIIRLLQPLPIQPVYPLLLHDDFCKPVYQ